MCCEIIFYSLARAASPSCSQRSIYPMEAHCNRSEYKFTIAPAIVPELYKTIRCYLAPDRNLEDGYIVITEYFDSVEDILYWQKIDGCTNRRRLRSRIYLDPCAQREPSAFIEIKHKLNGLTVKRRISTSLTEVASFSKRSRIDVSKAEEVKTRDEINRMAEQYKLVPRVQMRYHRHAYDNGADGNLRITFDHEVRCRSSEMRELTADDGDFETAITSAGEMLMEVKTIGPVPFWFRKLCATLALTPTSFSKYTAAIAINRL